MSQKLHSLKCALTYLIFVNADLFNNVFPGDLNLTWVAFFEVTFISGEQNGHPQLGRVKLWIFFLELFSQK